MNAMRSVLADFTHVYGLVASVVVLLTAPTVVLGQSSTRGHPLEDPMVVGRSFLPPKHPEAVSSLTLRPDARSRTVLPAFEMDRLPNGKQHLRAVLISQKGKEERLIFFEIDAERGTYRTYAPEDLPERGPMELERLRRDSVDKLVTVRCTCATNPCSGSWTARVTTYDPIAVALTETIAAANWRQAATGPETCKLLASGTKACWSAHPSSLGTHWFISGCSISNHDPLGVDYSVGGSYYNWDFGFDSEYTFVTQNVRIQLRHGIGVVTSYQHNDDGEGASLIFGSFYESGGNTCFNW